MKKARNLKKALPGHENGARIEFLEILGQNAKIAQGARKNSSKHKCMFWGDFAGNRPRKQKNRARRRKRPKLLGNQRKSGQIDEKNARNPKKALPGRENGTRIEFFNILGQNVKNRPRSPEY